MDDLVQVRFKSYHRTGSVVVTSLSSRKQKILFNALTDYLIMELNLFKAGLFEKDLIGLSRRLVELTLFWILFFVLGNHTTVLL